MKEKNTNSGLKIKVKDQTGNDISLSTLFGKLVVIYFYPKDNTPGCTKEACSFRDSTNEFEKLGVTVIGVSADSVDSHNKFAEKHNLNFPLWSDPDKKLLTAFGAVGEKSMFGRKYIGIKRMTFVLDKTGKLIKVWQKVKPANHAQEVLDFIKTI